MSTQQVSRALSAQYDRPCPTCAAGANEPCRTLATGRVTDVHALRYRNERRALAYHCTACEGRGRSRNYVDEHCCTCCIGRDGSTPGQWFPYD